MFGRSCYPIYLALCGLFLAHGTVVAQPITGAPFRHPNDEILETPEYVPPPEPALLQLPPVELAPEEAPLSQQVRVYVKKIRLRGNTVFPEDQLREETNAYEGRYIDSSELENLRRELTLYYVNHGYINSGAVIPDQRVIDGVVTLMIVEGELTGIQTRGLTRLRPEYVNHRIRLGVEDPLNVDSLSEALQLLQRNPRIERLNAALYPGTEPGDAVLDVEVAEAPAFSLWVGADNTRPPPVGSEQGFVRGLHRNLTGFGDTLSFEIDATDGLEAYDVSYAFPVTPRDTDVKLWYVRNDSSVVESPFDNLDINSDERSYGVGLSHPAYRTLNHTLRLGAGIERRKSKTTLLNQPFSFSPGAEDGTTKIWVLRLTQEWRDQRRLQVMAARSTFSFGLDTMDATVNGNDGDGEFIAWLGQVQVAHRFGKENQLIARSALQLSNDPLPALEQFSVGGLYTVRGYRENQQVTDQGLIASLELRFPVWSDKDGELGLQFAPFYDYGAVWNRHRPTPGPQYFSGAGAGLVGHYGRRFEAALYLAHAFQHFDNTDNDLQDDGVYFTITAKLF